MKQGTSPVPAARPTFSLIIETENLANADLGGLSQALASLERQQIPPAAASEVLIVDWLGRILAPFQTGDAVNIVAGETRTGRSR